ncbi:MAG: DUF4149 domain-containing protein [Candidatus Dadabacteria bacterium]|nr:DUF4149 domain-containing protein [Candidatus Dadabacteria bacterium]
MTFIKFLFLVSVCFWLGSIFFFSAVTAPSIFGTLPKQQAGVIITIIFNKYYLIQYVLAGISIISLLLLIIFDKNNNRLRYLRLTLVCLMLILTVFSGTYIRNSALQAKAVMKHSEPGSKVYIKAEKTFKGSHRNSVIVNGLVFLAGIVILLNIAKRNEL